MNPFIRHMRRFLFAFIAVVLLEYGSAPAAWACSCDRGPVERSFENADFVATGRVAAMAVVDWKQGLRRITFHIDRAVKPLPPGPLEPRTDLYTLVHGVSCWGYDLDVGRDYVLFATRPERMLGGRVDIKLPPGGLLVWLCGGTVERHNLYGNRTVQALEKIVRR